MGDGNWHSFGGAAVGAAVAPPYSPSVATVVEDQFLGFASSWSHA